MFKRLLFFAFKIPQSYVIFPETRYHHASSDSEQPGICYHRSQHMASAPKLCENHFLPPSDFPYSGLRQTQMARSKHQLYQPLLSRSIKLQMMPCHTGPSSDVSRMPGLIPFSHFIPFLPVILKNSLGRLLKQTENQRKKIEKVSKKGF